MQKLTQRIAKIISNAGICSRRDAETLIISGKVKIDGVTIISPATLVTKENKIEVSGQLIQQNHAPRLWLYHKPVGLITTHKDTHSRATIFENLPKDLPRVISIGRLDLNSEGLLLLTNNGDLARSFELPSSNIERVYKVRAYGDPKSLLKNYENITIDGMHYNPHSIILTQTNGNNSWFEVILTEGKNREIRKIFDYFHLAVNRLIRIKYGEFILGDLKPNQCEEVNLRK